MDSTGTEEMGSEKDGLALGDVAPDFTLDSSDDGQVRLSDYRGEHNVLVYFMREFT